MRGYLDEGFDRLNLAHNALSHDDPRMTGEPSNRYRILAGPGSPYSHKVRAVMRHRRIPHHWVIVLGGWDGTGQTEKLSHLHKNQLPIVPGRAGEQFEFLSSALSHSIHWLPYLALTSRCQLAIASAIAAPSPRISRAWVNGLNLAFPAALSRGLHSHLWAYAWVGSLSDAVCAPALNVSTAVTSAAKAPRQSIDFGIIDTTPSHGFKVACIHSTTTQTQHACFVCGEPRSASALRAARDPSQNVSLRSRLDSVLSLNF